MMRILMILQTDFPPDIRVEKEAKALLSAGHEIHLVCKNQRNLPEEDGYSNIHIHRLRTPGTFSPRISSLLMFPAPHNPVWKKRVYGVIRYNQIEAIHVHDLPLAPLAIKAGKKFGIPVVFDMHENYPEALKAWNKRGIEKLLKNHKVAKWVERRAVRQTTRIIVVVEEQKERLVQEGVSAEKITIVSNTVDLERFRATEKNQRVRKQMNEDFILSYAGGIDENRGLETLIKGFSIANKQLASTKLVIIGDGRSRPRLEKLAADYGLEESVVFPGWIDFDQLPGWIAASDVCLIPQPANGHANTTIPHKIFQYMALGKPIITSDAKPLARIVTECQCGEYFRSDSPEDLAQVIIRMYHSAEQYGENGKKWVNKKYNWQITSKALLEVYNSLNRQD